MFNYYFHKKPVITKNSTVKIKNLAVNHDSLSRTLGYITYVNKNA